MDQLNNLKEQLIIDEEYKEEIYLDNSKEKNPTFGIGHKIKPTDPEKNFKLRHKISKQRIESAFASDIKVIS